MKIVKDKKGNASFLVDGRKVHQQSIPIDDIQKIGFLICGKQTVEFDNFAYKEIQ